jgi:bifunctional non-homologous end joining protein LigD
MASRVQTRRNPSVRAEFIPPMKALGVSAIPGAGEWHCEIKFDGYRAVVLLNEGRVELWSRNQKPLDYPEVIPALAKLKCRSAVLDGEIVALDAKGHSDFQTLQGRAVGERPPIVLFLFDLLQLDGRMLLAEPIEQRRDLLKELIGKGSGSVRLSPSFDVSPERFLSETRKQGLEGMILKLHGSVYEPDRRSGTWLKVKNINEQEFVIGGFTPPKNSREYFGSILIGCYEDGKLLYCGKVGSGFDRRLLASLHAKFVKLATAKPPFSNLPLSRRPRFGQGMTASAMRVVTWVKPRLVAQIKFTEWTQDGLLRQPVFLGLRSDKPAKQVRREAAVV